MRPGGREIETVTTQGPGTLEFLPNLPVQHHRVLTGNDMVIPYGAANRIESFRATAVRTQTEPTADEKKRNRGVFRHRQQADGSALRPQDQPAGVHGADGRFHLRRRRPQGARGEGHARFRPEHDRCWRRRRACGTPTGSTSADRIRMDQRTGDFTAEGNVNSSRLPDKDPKKNSQMLSGDEPLQAQARTMDSTNHNQQHPLRRQRADVAGRQPHQRGHHRPGPRKAQR